MMVPLCPFEAPFITPLPVFFLSPPHDAAPPPHILHVYRMFHSLERKHFRLPAQEAAHLRAATDRLQPPSCAEGSVIMALLLPCSSPPSTPSYHPSIISSSPPLISPPLPLTSSTTFFPPLYLRWGRGRRGAGSPSRLP